MQHKHTQNFTVWSATEITFDSSWWNLYTIYTRVVKLWPTGCTQPM